MFHWQVQFGLRIWIRLIRRPARVDYLTTLISLHEGIHHELESVYAITIIVIIIIITYYVLFNAVRRGLPVSMQPVGARTASLLRLACHVYMA